MAISRRFQLAGYPQHVVQRGNNGQPCFVGEQDFTEYLSRLRAASERFEVAVHAYVLMGNHVHLLATPSTPDGISRCMQAVGCGYVRSFNARHGRTGTLWDCRYFASLVGTDRYLWSCYRYIELNPVRALMVSAPAEYRWSSHGANAHGRLDPIVRPHPAYVGLGANAASRSAAYRRMFETDLEKAIVSEIRERLSSQRGFGSEEFLASVEASAGRSPRPLRRGRPRTRLIAEPSQVPDG